jgi:hypothetical protein
MPARQADLAAMGLTAQHQIEACMRRLPMDLRRMRQQDPTFVGRDHGGGLFDVVGPQIMRVILVGIFQHNRRQFSRLPAPAQRRGLSTRFLGKLCNRHEGQRVLCYATTKRGEAFMFAAPLRPLAAASRLIPCGHAVCCRARQRRQGAGAKAQWPPPTASRSTRKLCHDPSSPTSFE